MDRNEYYKYDFLLKVLEIDSLQCRKGSYLVTDGMENSIKRAITEKTRLVLEEIGEWDETYTYGK